jgi:hypothetical protein
MLHEELNSSLQLMRVVSEEQMGLTSCRFRHWQQVPVYHCGLLRQEDANCTSGLGTETQRVMLLFCLSTKQLMSFSLSCGMRSLIPPIGSVFRVYSALGYAAVMQSELLRM